MRTTVLDLEASALRDAVDAWCVGACCLPEPDVRAAAHRALLRVATADLDARGPYVWRARVRAADLDMASARWCLLGQLYGDYAAGLRVLYGDDLWYHDVVTDAVRGALAFTSNFPTEAWLPVLAGYAP